ncbi:MAG: gliding motility-associated C-terminal domain-containing protein [Bacteroidota bacterium]
MSQDAFGQGELLASTNLLKIPLDLQTEHLRPGAQIKISTSSAAVCTGGGNQSVGGFTLCADETDATNEEDRNFFWVCCTPPGWSPSEAYEYDFPSIESVNPCVAGATVDELILTITIEDVTFDLGSPYACCEQYLEGLFANLYDNCPPGTSCPVAGDGLRNTTNPGMGDCLANGENLNYDAASSSFPLGIPFTSTTDCLNAVISTSDQLGVDIVPSFRYDLANAAGCNCPADLISQGLISVEYSLEVEYVFCSNDLPTGCFPSTFTQIDPLCENDPAVNLPTTSNNGVNGSWNPPTINPAGQGGSTITAIFTPDPGQCVGGTSEMDIEINSSITPTFTQIDPLCESDPPVPLSSTSNNGVTGSWDVGTSFDPSGQGGNTVTITFTPDPGLCASIQTMDINVLNDDIPLFTQIDPLCESDPPVNLPAISNNGFTGSWDVGATFDPSGQGGNIVTITFNPDPGQCADMQTMDIVVDDQVTPSFTPIGPLCESDPPVALPANSNNGVPGSWDVGTTFDPAGQGGTVQTITFTPAPNTCALSATMDITVEEQLIPDFTQIGPLCEDDPPVLLPDISNNGVAGTWDVGTTFDPSGQGGSVATINFTPNPGQCASGQSMQITVEFLEIPSFTPIGNVCEGDPPIPLPSVSNNGVAGTWDVGTSFDPAGQGGNLVTLTFTPDASECAITQTMDVLVFEEETPTFIQLGPYCESDPVVPLPFTSDNGYNGSWDVGVSFDPSNYAGSTTTIIFTPDPGQCASTADMDVVVIAEFEPTFDPIGPLCEDDAPVNLPAVSIEGATGSWDVGTVFDPAGNNGNNNLTFAPDAGQCASSTVVSVLVNDLPDFTLIDVSCNPSLADYFIDLQTDGDNVTSTAGTVNDNGGGSFLIDGIPQGTDVQVTILNTTTGCEEVFDVTSPNCGCPAIAPPTGDDVEFCEGSNIPELVAATGAGLEIDWYDMETGGVLLLGGSTTYTPLAAGSYYVESVDPNSGCTSTTRTEITLSVIPLDTMFTTATSCDPLAVGVDTTVYNTSTCDSIVITTTTLLNGDETNLTASSCDPNQVGLDTMFLTNLAGCDSLVITNTSLSPADTMFAQSTTCDPMMVGVDTTTFTTSTCDSVVITTTTLLNGDETNLTATSCDPNQVGLDTMFLTNLAGCDSLVITTTSLSPADTMFAQATSCDPSQVGIDTTIFTTSTCDSVVITTTTLLAGDETNLTATSCDPMQLGVDTVFLTNLAGCDSLVITMTSLAPPDTFFTQATSCDPLAIGIDTTIFATTGCDSLVITTTTLEAGEEVNVIAFSCDPALVGIDTAFLTNLAGCDSLVITTTSLSAADTMFAQASSCDPLQVGVDTMVFTTATCDSVVITTTVLADSDEFYSPEFSCDAEEVGIDTMFFTNLAGCDSLIITETFFLAADTSFAQASTCDPSEVGVDTTFFSTATCDSVVITTITLDNGDEVFQSDVTCDPSAVGLDTVFLTNQNGCDSLIITDFVFEEIDPTFINATSCDLADVGIDTVIFNTNNCDSLVITTTTLVQASETVFSEVTCVQGQAGADTIFLTNQAGCDSLVITNIVFESAITDASLNVIDPSCIDPFGSIEVVDVVGGVSPYVYSIDAGATFGTDQNFNLLVAGDYEIIVEDANGCQFGLNTSLADVLLPEVFFNPESIDVLLGDAELLNPNTTIPDSSIASIVWTPVEQLSCTDCLTPLATPFTSTEYLLTVEDLNGCSASASIFLNVIERTRAFAPNIISPNGDGINDGFTIFSAPGYIETIISMKVFDRWGGNVYENFGFQPNDPQLGWNGTKDGDLVGSGVYVFVAELGLANGERLQMEGEIMVLR